jgi:Icc protein
MLKITIRTLVLVCSFTLFSCENLFQYNPNQIVLKDSERNLNLKNIEKIKSLPVTDTVRFILMGDTQRWYDESADFVKSANAQKGVSFVVHSGDISDFGLSQEFKWVNEILLRLRYPYITVVGNHDTVANGNLVFERMYGPLDYSFEFGQNKFILINNNSREYNFNGVVPNLNWLQAELNSNTSNKNAIVIGHIPPFDSDFDPKLQEEYARMLAADPNVQLTLYGHQHSFKEGDLYDDGVSYLVTTSMGDRGYYVITAWKGGYRAARVKF